MPARPGMAINKQPVVGDKSCAVVCCHNDVTRQMGAAHAPPLCRRFLSCVLCPIGPIDRIDPISATLATCNPLPIGHIGPIGRIGRIGRNIWRMPHVVQTHTTPRPCPTPSPPGSRSATRPASTARARSHLSPTPTATRPVVPTPAAASRKSLTPTAPLAPTKPARARMRTAPKGPELSSLGQAKRRRRGVSPEVDLHPKVLFQPLIFRRRRVRAVSGRARASRTSCGSLRFRRPTLRTRCPRNRGIPHRARSASF